MLARFWLLLRWWTDEVDNAHWIVAGRTPDTWRFRLRHGCSRCRGEIIERRQLSWRLLRRWLDSWAGVGLIAAGMAHSIAGAGVGTAAVAGGAAGGVGGGGESVTRS
jgi:hypothetical protein